MKAFSLLVISSFIMVLYSRVNAQATFGPVLGVNFSGIIGGYSYINYDHDYGVKAGAMANFPLSKKSFLHTEILFDSKSYKYHYTTALPIDYLVTDARVYEHSSFGYIEAPVMIGRKFSSGLHADAGLFIGYQVSQRETQTMEYEVYVNSVITEVTAVSTTNEISADRFQLGVQTAVGYVNSGFDLSLTSQYHLTPLYYFATDVPEKQHFLNLSLALAYRFNGAKKISKSSL